MRGLVLGVLLTLAVPAAAREPIEPAELPPPDYRGLQYVDSKGCLFMRAGTPGNVLWLPRVTREGVPLCGNPPSGNRVPVVEEGAPVATEAAPTTPTAEPAPKDPAPVKTLSGYFVAVGSYSLAENAQAAEARLKALNYKTARGTSGGLTTILAGPYASETDAARARGELTKLGFPDAIVLALP